MTPRHGAQHHPRARLILSLASPGGSPSANTTAMQQQGPGAPDATPVRASPKAAQQQAGKGAPHNPNWWLLVVVAALGIVICYADRSNMSTAILPMAEAYQWDKAFEGVVLSAFFAGYAATQILGGSLADRYGGKLVLTAGVFLWSVFTVATPGAAAAGTAPLLAARVLLGVGEGVAFPAIHSIIARNVPVNKRSTAVGIVTAASYAGTALAFGLSPWLISKFGWQWVFYLFGGSALLWLPLWLPLNVISQLSDDVSSSSRGGSSRGGKQSPSEGGTEEQPLLPRASFEVDARAGSSSSSSSLQQAAAGSPSAAAVAAASSSSGGSNDGGGGSSTGFKALMRRREVWAICLCQYSQSYGMYGLLTWLPTFFTEYYEVKLGDLGGYTLLPYLIQGLVGAGAGALADQLLSGQGWSVRSVRVVLQLTGMLGPAVCLMAAVSPLVGGSAEAASALITVGLGLSALTLGAVSVNHLDIAPRHAGMVFGAGNTAATLAGLVSVPLTGWVLQRTASWPLVFGLIAGHFVMGSALWFAWVGDKPLPEDGPDQPAAVTLEP